MRDRVERIIAPAVLWLALWALGAAWVGKELLLPSPLAVARALWALGRTGAFWRDLACTLGRVALGFGLGTVLGMLLGWLTAASRWADALLSPALRAVRTIPVVSFILILYFCLSTGRVPVAACALMTLPVIWRAARQGIDAADPQLLELSAAYRLGAWKTFRLVRLPAALPALCAGWETALGLAWKSNLAAEVLCQPKWAAGSGLQSAKATLDAAGVWAWTAAVVALSLVLEALLRRGLSRWRGGGAL